MRRAAAGLLLVVLGATSPGLVCGLHCVFDAATAPSQHSMVHDGAMDHTASQATCQGPTLRTTHRLPLLRMAMAWPDGPTTFASVLDAAPMARTAPADAHASVPPEIESPPPRG